MAQQTSEEQARQILKGCLYVVIGAFVVAVGCTAVLAAVGSGGGSTSGTTARISACLAAQDAVRDQLAAPGSADFPGCFGDTLNGVVEEGPGRYRVRGYVDAENRFGALLRADYIVSVQLVGDDRYRATVLALETR